MNTPCRSDLQAQIDAGTTHVLFDSHQELNIVVHFTKIAPAATPTSRLTNARPSG